MKLRAKVLVVVLFTFILMLMATYLSSLRILERSYLRLEDQQVLMNVHRVHKAITQLESGLDNVVNNWSVWNDAYQFVIDKNQAFITSNFNVAIFLTTDIDILVIYNSNGDYISGFALSLDRSKEAPIPNELFIGLKPHAPFWKLIAQPKMDSDNKGLIALGNEILIFASRTIITSEGKGPPHGTMLMAKYVNADVVKKLKETTDLNITLYHLSDIENNKDLKKIASQLKGEGTFLSQSGEAIFGYSLLRDINDKPIGMFKIEMPRSIYAVGVNTIRYFNILFLLSGVIFSLLLFYWLSRLVIKRLEKMHQRIVEIDKTKDFSLLLPEEGSDEITMLEKETNKMLATIQAYNMQKHNLLEKISDEVASENALSKQLQISEAFLTEVINAMPSALVIVDNNMNIVTLNHQAKKQIQISSENVKGKSLFLVCDYLQKYETDCYFSLKKQTKQVLNKICDIRDASPRYFDVVLYPLVHKKNTFLVVRIDDVTQNMKLEDKLIQNDKLASIGVLTAGVAHEINNPINFISASIIPLKNNLTDLIKIINKYAELKSDMEGDEKLKEIAELKQTTNIHYLVQETKQLIAGIQDGVNRTATIVQNLKVFSRFDEGKIAATDIHAAINSTLNLLEHNSKNRIEIIKEYDNTIPKVECYPGKLTQVFMNIIANAMEAISDKGKIIIKTEKLNNQIKISIKDTGMGISEENKSKIFDPFFTTKSIGQGTGLGLSIAAAFIRELKGSLDVESKLNQGAEFIIILPISQTGK